jgi:hypothetical protein
MKNRDVIAGWLLVIFLLILFGQADVALTEAWRAHSSIGTIAWRLFCALASGAGGIFLLVHHIHRADDLQYYENLENQRDRDARQASMQP